MDAVLLTWRWQNILSVWIMVLALVFGAMIISQVMLRTKGKAAADAAV